VIWFPLFLVVCISSMKDYFEDHKRHVSDMSENTRMTSILTEDGFMPCEWQHVRVGNIVKV
jgi:phospholipid-transporting ATPase